MWQLIGVMLTLTLRWPIYVASAISMALFAARNHSPQLWPYLALVAVGAVLLAALDWISISLSSERELGPMTKFTTYLAIESTLSVFVCMATIVAFK
jgi:hypothetical protein